MQQFTIKDIEHLTQIKAHTWRIWEQRYQFFTTNRKESNHHIYNNDDLKHLLRIAFLYHNGWKISKIAQLNFDRLKEEVYKTEINSTSYQYFIIQLLEAAFAFDEPSFIRILDEVIAIIGFEKTITKVCYPYLQRIGLLWITNNVIPAQEHFSSYLIQNKIISEIDQLTPVSIEPNLILFSPKGEHHELPLFYLHYLFRKKGWGLIYLGTNITKETLQQFANNDSIAYLFLHLITNFTGWEPDLYFEDLCRTFFKKKIIATGTIVHQMQRSFVNLKLLKTDEEIYRFIELKTDE